jgi:hypothetical protein
MQASDVIDGSREEAAALLRRIATRHVLWAVLVLVVMTIGCLAILFCEAMDGAFG